MALLARYSWLNEFLPRDARFLSQKVQIHGFVAHTSTVRNAERLLQPALGPILREVHAPELLVLALL